MPPLSAAFAPAWLTARPIAHRGLHDAAAGRIENTVAAALAAADAGYAIECDARPSRDGEAIVFHDDTLARLAGIAARVVDMDAAGLAAVRLDGAMEGPPTLPRFLAAVGGRVPVICEIKSAFDGDTRNAERIATIARDYGGPIALKSFDPSIIAFLRREAARLGIGGVPLGMIAQVDYSSPRDEWARLSADDRRGLAQFLHWPETRPDFLSWRLRDLPHATPFLLREVGGLPVMAWTARAPDDVAIARRWADQMVFEGFRP